ncbi:MAG: hypothetical protein OXB94_04980 [Nitrospira sp.]|nr:hypothetical protein [Nitrospira sp.]
MHAGIKTWYSGLDRMGNREPEEGVMNVPDQSRTIHLSLLVLCLGWCLTGTSVSVAENSIQNVQPPLARAKVYLAAGDYRRAVEACQMNIDQSPSVESYVYLIYVYHALDGYLESLAERDEWVKVGQLSLSMVNRGTMDLVDPPDMLARMAKEILHEGIRQQYDVVAGMANRLDKTRADELWLEVRAWEKQYPENWWAGVPEQWKWEDTLYEEMLRPEGIDEIIKQRKAQEAGVPEQKQ